MPSFVIRNWNMHVIGKPIVTERGIKYRDADKMALIPVKNVAIEREALLRRSEWMRIKPPADSTRTQGIKAAMHKNGLYSVCEEVFCPNLAECFNHGIATFMIPGVICTRRCPFCDIVYGRPTAPNANEPMKLVQTIADMVLCYVVIIFVDRDGLCDGDAQHLVDCITVIRKKGPQIKIETLVPGFRGRMDRALDILTVAPPGVFNHNLKNVLCIYHQAQPGADYNWSLKLLERSKEAHLEMPTKSGLMVGLGGTNEEVIKVMRDLRRHGVMMLVPGQYLQPSCHHLPVQRYVSPDEFDEMKVEALAMGFTRAAYGPPIRFSYHADSQVKRMEVK